MGLRALAVAVCLAASARGGDGAAWRELPADVVGARFGPDGRLWLRVRGTPTEDAIARQCARQAPRVAADPVLFGPGRRVWFRFGGAVRGYDGTTWVRGPDAGGRALAVAGRAFLAGDEAVHAFDGRRWTRSPGGRRPGARLLVREQDGRGVVAYRPGANRILRWRDGRWQVVAVLAPVDLTRVRALVPGAGGVWLATPTGLVFAPFDEARPVPDWDRLFEGVRQRGARGARAVLAHGPTALGAIEDELATERSPETRRWLLALRRALRERTSTEAGRARFGPYRAHDPVLQWTDGRRLVVWSRRVVGPDLAGAGLLVFDGRWRAPRGRPFARPWRRTGAAAPVHLDRRRLVLPPRDRHEGIAVIDSRTGATLARLQRRAYRIPVAAHPRGGIVVAPAPDADPAPPLAVWRPHLTPDSG